MAESSGDKKHPASERRRDQARREGQMPRSTDLTSATLLLVAVALLRWMGPQVVDQMGLFLTESLSNAGPRVITTSDAVHTIGRIMMVLSLTLLPLCGAFLLGTVTVNLAQTGILFLPEKATPQWSHVNPVSGFQRMISLPNFVRLGFGLFKLGVVVFVAYYALKTMATGVITAADLTAAQVAHLLIDLTLQICMRIGGALFVLALLDYGFQRWKFEQDLMMTDQELRDEMKESEGDPRLKARRRQIHRQLAMQQLRKEVPKADAVVTNPTELAIAIRYDPQTMPAPLVVAKGAGFVAQTIRRIALEHGVPVVERKPLAQTLYKNVDVGQSVPVEQYQAVAEVLRYVYQLQGKTLPRARA